MTSRWFLRIAASAACAFAASFAGVASAEVAIGQKAPAIDGVNAATGAETSLKQLQGTKATVVAFTCNHCPVAVAYEDRFIEFAKAYKDKGVAFVAINCNHGESVEELKERAEAIAAERGVTLQWETAHESSAVVCDRRLTLRLENAVKQHQKAVPLLTSGAGHDAAALAAICPVAMLFVRCKGGISHNPAECASEADVRVAIAAMNDFLKGLSESK